MTSDRQSTAITTITPAGRRSRRSRRSRPRARQVSGADRRLGSIGVAEEAQAQTTSCVLIAAKTDGPHWHRPQLDGSDDSGRRLPGTDDKTLEPLGWDEWLAELDEQELAAVMQGEGSDSAIKVVRKDRVVMS